MVPTDSYTGTRGLFSHDEETGRIRVRSVDPTDTAAWIEAAGDADVLWLESPTDPSLHVMDVAGITAAVATLGRRPTIVVDNTFATPLGQRPLDRGADVVVHSATKFIGRHSDLLLGLTVAADPAVADRLREARGRRGATPGVLEAYLGLRGLRTLPVRLAEASATAATLARRLGEHPAVTRVRYPGTGAMLAFELSDESTADDFCGRLRLVRHATSLGGVESTVERRSGRRGDGHVTPGLVRFSVGLEDPEDLWSDINQALC